MNKLNCEHEFRRFINFDTGIWKCEKCKIITNSIKEGIILAPCDHSDLTVGEWICKKCGAIQSRVERPLIKVKPLRWTDIPEDEIRSKHDFLDNPQGYSIKREWDDNPYIVDSIPIYEVYDYDYNYLGNSYNDIEEAKLIGQNHWNEYILSLIEVE